MREPATFSLFVRHLPPQRGFLVCAGIESCLDYLEALSFEPAAKPEASAVCCANSGCG